MGDVRCTTRGCRCIARRDGLCHACLAAEAWKQVDELPPRLAWLDLGRLERCHPQPGWERNGRCYKRGNTRIFYPDGNETTTKAKAYCDGCPARYACLTAGLETPTHHDEGVWGGTTSGDRVKIRRALTARRHAA